MSLAEKILNPCNQSSPPVTEDEIHLLLKHLNDWCLVSENDTKMLYKEYKFKNYMTAQAFANQVAELAEQANHHPRICIEWGKAKISWWTHCINNLYINDFIMAARCDNLYFPQYNN